MSKELNGMEVWKPLKTLNPELLGMFEISNHGKLKSLPRTITRTTWRGGTYNSYVGGNLLSQRKSKRNKLLFSTITINVRDGNDDVTKHSESVYIHKAVAEAFVVNPKPKTYNMATHIELDDWENNHHSNVMWTNQSFLSKRNMERNPHNKTKLRDKNLENGYYENISSYRKQSRFGLKKSVRYFELKANRIMNNRSGKVAKQTVASLQFILNKYYNKLIDSKRFIFGQLSKKEREDIEILLPKHTTPRKKDT